MTHEEILQLLCVTCPHDHSPADAATWLMEACVANSINRQWATDYEPSPNCREQGIDLISRSGLHAPVQVKTAKGERQEGKAKRKTIIAKALTGAHKYGHKEALLATARFTSGKLDKLVVDDVKKLKDLNRGGFSFKQLKDWGFEELVLD